MSQFPRRRLFFDAINFRLDTSFFSPRLIGRFDFDNGYTASVVCFDPNEPNRRYELAVMHEGAICYDTPVTYDVVPHCNVAEIEDLLEQIACLPAKSIS